MKRFHWLSVLLAVGGITLLIGKSDARSRLVAQASSINAPAVSTCATPALSRFTRHKITSGETLDSIAQQYSLIPATLMGINPLLRGGKAPVGTEILVPPYNGIRVALKSNQTWRDVAKRYNVRPDVLFEVNGCQPTPKVVFVPGVNWSPVAPTASTTAPNKPDANSTGRVLSGYPLVTKPGRSALLLGYGWGIQPTTGKVGFHNGVDLTATIGSPVLAVADGTVAFAGKQGAYGNLVVINHAEGLQTRYAQLANFKVKVGQTVKRGQTIATVGTTGTPSSKAPHLHFEVRSRSKLGWVADNPEPFLLKERSTQAQK